MIFQQTGAEAARSLAALPVGTRARVVGLDGDDGVALRLLEMGLVPGVEVALLKRAPLGDPLELRVRGFHLSLRYREAASVRVEVLT